MVHSRMVKRSFGTTLLGAYVGRLSATAPSGMPVKKLFASAVGLSQTELSHFLAGRRAPNLQQAVAIGDATAGAVPVRAWCEPSPE